MSQLKSMDLSTGWYIAKDPDNVGKTEGWETAVREDAVAAYVPSIIQQFFPEYHGTAYYWCRFTPTLCKAKGERQVLRFGGADYYAEAWLNGVYLGSYEGGETPFSFDVTDSLTEGENLLAVRVINPCDRLIDGMNLMNTPHRNKTVVKGAGRCLNHGGLWYGVTLASLPAVYIEDTFLEGDIVTGELRLHVTLRSSLAKVCRGELKVSVYEKADHGYLKTAKAVKISATPKDSLHELSLTVPDFKLWSTDDPHLYRVEIELTTAKGTQSVSVSFGFRKFEIREGFFYLNDKKIFLKSAHSGNAFPVGQMMPVHPEHTRQDFIYAKASGFNMLRGIAGMFRPEQLDFADEMGLLIYEECFAAGCMAYSELYTWKTEEELHALVEEKKLAMPIGDEKTMLDRWVNSTENMILRDRNHPSVVIWGLLNETQNNSVYRTARAFLPRARELDPSRLILLNSSRWDFEVHLGSACNPYGDTWECCFGPEGHPELWDPKRPHQTMGDSHHYAHVPFTKDDINVYRNMGKNTPFPVFLSEFGVGANFHVIEEFKHFAQYGHRLDLEDAEWLKRQSDTFTKLFYDLGMDRLFPFPDAALKESQRINADDRKRIFDILRSNPRICGYSITGLLDHGMCGEGLWSYWRRWKPGMFDVISEGFSRLRFSLFATPCVYAGDEITVEATLANEGVLTDGTYTADFAIISDVGVVTRFTESFPLKGDDFATPIMKRTLKMDVPAGKYYLTASLREGTPVGDTTFFHVFEKRPALHPATPVYAVALTESEREGLRCILPDVKPYEGETDGVVIAGNTAPDDTRKLMAAAEAGAKVLFLDKETFANEENVEIFRVLDTTFAVKNYPDWLYHKDYVLLSPEVFDGIEGKLAPLTAFGPVWAKRSLEGERIPDRVLCPGFLTGTYYIKGGCGATNSMIGYRHGAGEVCLNTFNLLSEQGHPIADRILYNLIALFTK